MFVYWFMFLIPIISYPIYIRMVRSFIFKSSNQSTAIFYAGSLSVNTFFLSLFVFDFYITTHNIDPWFLHYIWRVVYWINFTFGVIVFPILCEREKNPAQLKTPCLLLRFYLRRLIIIGSITIGVLSFVFLMFDIPYKKLAKWENIYLAPILAVTVWGYFLLILHFSLAFVVIPKKILRCLFSGFELGKFL
jgi:hypothetical protein